MRKRERRARRGANRASLAVSHSLLVAVWHMLQTGETYTDPGGDYYTRRNPERTTRRLVAQLERLGHTVTLTEGTPPDQRDFLVRDEGRQHRSSVLLLDVGSTDGSAAGSPQKQNCGGRRSRAGGLPELVEAGL